MTILVASISFSLEHYDEIKKLFMKNPDGTSKVQNHVIEALFSKALSPAR